MSQATEAGAREVTREIARETNMADVARESGVSIATVSRALRGMPGVSEPTRERIRQIASDLSYVVSPEASGLSKGSTGRVAIVVPQLDAWFYGAMLSSMAPVLRSADLEMLVYQVDGEAERSRFVQELPARRKADAVILTALPMAADEMQRLDLIGVHVVVAGGRVRQFPHVMVDDAEVGRMAVGHLLDLGHRRIAMIRTADTDQTAWSSDLLRTEAWRSALVAAGAEPAEDLLVSEPYDLNAGARGITRLLALPDPPTALCAYSDEIALTAMAAARMAGVRVPEDLSVIGIDGHPLGEAFGLTTVDQDVAAQGRLAARAVVHLVEGGTVADTLIEPRLVVRRSTAPIPT